MRDIRYEQLLNHYGVEWEYIPKFNIEEGIDRERSLRNQARLEEPIDKSLVSQYTIDYKDSQEGNLIPALVIWRPNHKSKGVAIDGNHRIEVYAEVGRAFCDVYLVTSTDEMVIDRLTGIWNKAVNGKRPTQAELLQLAKGFVRKHKYPVKEAAKEWSVSYAVLLAAIRSDKIRDALFCNNVPPRLVSRLTPETLRRIGPLMDLGVDILVSMVHLIAEFGLAEEDTKNIVAKIHDAKTSEDKSQVITDFRNTEYAKCRKAATKNGTIKLKQSPLSVFIKRMDLLESHLAEFDPKESKVLKPVGSEYRSAKLTAINIVNGLSAIFALRDRQTTEAENHANGKTSS